VNCWLSHDGGTVVDVAGTVVTGGVVVDGVARVAAVLAGTDGEVVVDMGCRAGAIEVVLAALGETVCVLDTVLDVDADVDGAATTIRASVLFDPDNKIGIAIAAAAIATPTPPRPSRLLRRRERYRPKVVMRRAVMAACSSGVG